MEAISLDFDLTLYVCDALGNYSVATTDQVLEAARVAVDDKFKRETVLTSSASTREFLKHKIGTLEREVFAVLFLDNQHGVIAYEELFQGTIDGAAVYPREVVKSALLHNAAAVIFAHNHPSGVSEPSNADISITQKLRNALDVVEIRVLDHIVVGGSSVTSFAERNLL